MFLFSVRMLHFNVFSARTPAMAAVVNLLVSLGHTTLYLFGGTFGVTNKYSRVFGLNFH